MPEELSDPDQSQDSMQPNDREEDNARFYDDDNYRIEPPMQMPFNINGVGQISDGYCSRVKNDLMDFNGK